jgi:hypothetical protein
VDEDEILDAEPAQHLPTGMVRRVAARHSGSDPFGPDPL